MDSDNTEKYSLRPRNLIRKKTKSLQDSSDDDQANQSVNSTSETLTDKGLLKKVKSKSKSKPPPLSKYRRKTANARERSRMHEINVAFETLRQVVPNMATAMPAKSATMNEKLTKITTLRLAMRYIKMLNGMLQENQPIDLPIAISIPNNSNINSNSDNSNSNSNNTTTSNNEVGVSGKINSDDFRDLFSECSDLDCLLTESDRESLALSDQSSSLLASSTSPHLSDSLSSVDFDDPTTLLTCHDFVDQPLSVCEFNELFLV